MRRLGLIPGHAVELGGVGPPCSRGGYLREPLAHGGRGRTLGGLPEERAEVAHVGVASGHAVVDLRRVAVDVVDRPSPREERDVGAGLPDVEPAPENEQQVRLPHRRVRPAVAVRPDHADAQRMTVRQDVDRHQRVHDGDPERARRAGGGRRPRPRCGRRPRRGSAAAAPRRRRPGSARPCPARGRPPGARRRAPAPADRCHGPGSPSARRAGQGPGGPSAPRRTPRAGAPGARPRRGAARRPSSPARPCRRCRSPGSSAVGPAVRRAAPRLTPGR